MKLWVAYCVFGWSCLLIALLAVAGCTGTEPSGPDFNISGNSGPVTVNSTTGSSSPVGTAPCGAASSQKNGQNLPAAPNCSTTEVVAPEGEPEAEE